MDVLPYHLPSTLLGEPPGSVDLCCVVLCISDLTLQSCLSIFYQCFGALFLYYCKDCYITVVIIHCFWKICKCWHKTDHYKSMEKAEIYYTCTSKTSDLLSYRKDIVHIVAMVTQPHMTQRQTCSSAFKLAAAVSRVKPSPLALILLHQLWQEVTLWHWTAQLLLPHRWHSHPHDEVVALANSDRTECYIQCSSDHCLVRKRPI